MTDLLDQTEPELDVEPEQDPPLEVEPEDEPVELEPELPPVEALATTALMQVLPAGFPLPALIKFVPNQALKVRADEAAAYARGLEVHGAEGLQRADLALTALRTSLRAIEDHFSEPVEIANKLHKGLTGTRAEWLAPGKIATETVGRKVFVEQKRLEAIAQDERRKAQAEADRIAREQAAREADAAATAKAPEPVVQELRRQAETATAAPVATQAQAPMRGTIVVATWKARFKGCPGSDEANPCVDELTEAQRFQLLELLKAIADGRAPLAAVEPNWSYLNKRAKADKSTLQIPGIEAFEDGGVRAKGTRAK